MSALVRRVMQSAVAWSFLGTFLRAGASVLALPLVLRKLPPEHLGMWYVFGSLGSFAMLLDFGFEATIARMTAYVWAGASQLTAFGLHQGSSPAGPNRPLFVDLLATLRAYYRMVGLGLLILLSVGGGLWVWAKSAGIPEAETVRMAWLIYSLGICLNFVGGRWPALLSGIGVQRTAQQVGVIGVLAYYLVAVTGLGFGFGLWSLVSAMLLMGIVMRAVGRIAFTRAADLPGGIPAPHFHRQIFLATWPNAWRTGLVSLGAFLIIQANTLVCSAFLDLTTTASYGISLQIVSMLVGLSAVWVQVKLPVIHQLRVAGALGDIARVFAERMRLVIASFAAGSLVIFFVAPLLLRRIGSRTELLPAPLLGTMLIIQFLEMHHSQYGALVLSENRNPFLKPALISGLLIVTGSVLLTPQLGVWGLLLSAGCVQLAFNNWWPVLRGIRGLNLSVTAYARIFFTGSRDRNHVDT